MSRVSCQILCGLAVMMICLSLVAKEIPLSKPERQGFSSERLNKITEHMNAKVEDGTMAGGMGLLPVTERLSISRPMVLLIEMLAE